MFSIWNDLLNLIFPPKPQCPFCNETVPGGELCGRCLAVIEKYRREPYCNRCGRLPGKGAALYNKSTALLCYECRKRDWPFVLARAAGPYESIMKEAIHRFKYAERRSLAGPLAGLMAETIRAEPSFAVVDLILSVPLSGEKLRHRGFNQAALLAREVGALLQIPVDGRSLVKGFETPSQAGLSRSARESNLAGAFQVTNAGKLQGKNILLIDDVFTTGSTLSAAATVLIKSGARQVFGLTAATGRYF